MRASDLAVFFAILNLSISLVTSAGVFGGSFVPASGLAEDYVKQVPTSGDMETWKDGSTEHASITSDLTGLAELIVSGIGTVKDLIIGMLTGVGDLAQALGMPAEIGTAIDSIITIIYALAIIEIKTGRGVMGG
tara:strand:+ start:46 stop:447 length:402 start_codon:yes stop_codon:yes gene_type:complete